MVPQGFYAMIAGRLPRNCHIILLVTVCDDESVFDSRLALDTVQEPLRLSSK